MVSQTDDEKTRAKAAVLIIVACLLLACCGCDCESVVKQPPTFIESFRSFVDRFEVYREDHRIAELESIYKGMNVHWEGVVCGLSGAGVSLNIRPDDEKQTAFIMVPKGAMVDRSIREGGRVAVDGRFSSCSVLGPIIVDATITPIPTPANEHSLLINR